MTETLPAKFFEEPGAAELERLRDEAREKRQISFDCFSAIVKGDSPMRVVCKRGYRLGGGNAVSIPLVSVLRGRSTKACKSCPSYYDGGSNEG